MIKIVFMGSPEFSVPALNALSNHQAIEVELVISQEDKKRGRNRLMPTPVKQAALDLGLKTYEPKNVNEDYLYERLDHIDPDFIVVIAYGQLIGDRLLSRFKDKIINIHSSLLPKYRGAAPMQAAIMAGDEKTGVCSMLIEKSMDTGDVLACKEIEINKNTTINQIHDSLSNFAAKLIVDTLLNYKELYEKRQKQDESRASYSKKIAKEDGHIDFNSTASHIDKQIRAYSSWPSSYAYLNDVMVKIHKINIIDKYTNNEIGNIIEANHNGIFVNCADKCIVITEVQFPNKKRMSVKSYLMGNEIPENGKFL